MPKAPLEAADPTPESNLTLDDSVDASLDSKSNSKDSDYDSTEDGLWSEDSDKDWLP